MNLRKTFVSTYEPVMKQKGFSRKNSIFHRLINDDIIQMLSYTDFKYSFTIQFQIAPLCTGKKYTRFMDALRVGILLGNEATAEWEKSSYCAKEMAESLEICEEHLFHYFDSIIDCSSYITGMRDIYTKAYGSKGEHILLVSNQLYGAGLKTGQYDIAINSYKAIIKQNEYAIKRNRECGIEPTEEQLDKLKSRYDDLRRLENIIEYNDINYINDYIKQMENISRNSYIKSFAKQKR